MAGAAKVIKSHVAKCGTPGRRKPRGVSSRNQSAASQRVGGYAGANFSNDIGRR
jgi:hypothetical protein